MLLIISCGVPAMTKHGMMMIIRDENFRDLLSFRTGKSGNKD